MTAGTPKNLTAQALLAALAPLLKRVRRDVSALKKPDGTTAWTNRMLDDGAMLEHLAGGTPRGVAPIEAGSDQTYVGLLDLDSHKGEVDWPGMLEVTGRLVSELQRRGVDPMAFRSTGGSGVHVLVLWDQPQDAQLVRAVLRRALAAVGLVSGTKGVRAGEVEVFPKQDRVPLDGRGNMFILPLAGKSEVLVPELGLTGPGPTGLIALVGKDGSGWPLVKTGVESALSDDELAAELIHAVSHRRPVVAGTRGPGGLDDAGRAKLRRALAAIPNNGEGLDYDPWRDTVFGVMGACAGDDEGVALVHEFSARSSKYDPKFIDERVLPYVKSDGRGITHRTVLALARQHGWQEVSAEDFDDLDELDAQRGPQQRAERAKGLSRGNVEVNSVGGGVVPAGGVDAEPGAVRTGLAGVAPAGEGGGAGGGGGGGGGGGSAWPPLIPRATTECSDQANVHRLFVLSDGLLMFSGGRWHWFCGTHWSPDEGAQMVWVLLAKLPAMIEVELKAAVEAWKAAADTAALIGDKKSKDAAKAADKRVTQLAAWKQASEMRARHVAVEQMARELLTRPATECDQDPWLWNTPNGTIDIRTGQIRDHDPADWITVMSPVAFDPFAVAPRFQAALLAMFGGNQRMVRFLLCLIGYSMTGSMRDHILPMAIGVGSNGKSTVFDVVDKLFGPSYFKTAAPSLMVGRDDRHPTELADLQGARFVVVHETNEYAQLREGVIKQVTGGDKIKARRMNQNFYEFQSTAKLWLVSNHRPTIRGQDYGIWRRVKEINFGYRFGTAAQVATGEADCVGDPRLGEALMQELPGILNLCLAGARDWCVNGIEYPPEVLAASQQYQESQDDVRMFARECCEVSLQASELLVDPTTGVGLYPAYVGWCKASGYRVPKSKVKFLASLEGWVPGYGVREGKTPGGSGEKRKQVRLVFGIRLVEG